MSVPLSTTPSNLMKNIGIFTFGDIPGLTDFIFYETTCVGGFNFISDPSLITASFPNLTNIDPTNQQSGFLQIDFCDGLTTLSTPNIASVSGNVVVANCAAITAISFPALTTITGVTVGASKQGLAIGACPMCTSANFPALTHCGGQFEFDQMPVGCTGNFPLMNFVDGDMIMTSTNMVTLSFPSLVTINGNVLGGFSPNLVTFSVPVWLPKPGSIIAFNSCPNLSAASVNEILARCVANASFTTGTVTLAGAAPTGQGITDKATLIGRGVSVTTN